MEGRNIFNGWEAKNKNKNSINCVIQSMIRYEEINVIRIV